MINWILNRPSRKDLYERIEQLQKGLHSTEESVLAISIDWEKSDYALRSKIDNLELACRNADKLLLETTELLEERTAELKEMTISHARQNNELANLKAHYSIAQDKLAVFEHKAQMRREKNRVVMQKLREKKKQNSNKKGGNK